MKMKDTSPEVTTDWGKLKKKEESMAKPKYDLKKKYQKETNKLMNIVVSYDAEEDELTLGIALRKDVTNAELLLRVEQHIGKCLRLVANGGEPVMSDTDVVGYIEHENCVPVKEPKKGK